MAPAMKKVAGGLRLDMAAYREVAAFAQFGSDLDRATQAQLGRGQRLQEILKQPQYAPRQLEQEVVAIYSGTRGFIDEIPVDQVQDWETAVLRHLAASHPDILQEITQTKTLSPELAGRLEEAIRSFNKGWRG